jgi:hypothetical protein
MTVGMSVSMFLAMTMYAVETATGGPVLVQVEIGRGAE